MSRKSIFLLTLSLALIIVACPGNKDPREKYKPALKSVDALVADLKVTEGNLNTVLAGASVPGKEGKSCDEVAGISDLDKKITALKAQLDKLKPKDMPMVTETVQSGIDPNTQQPTFENTTVIDWGKVTGDDQTIWGSMHTIATVLTGSVKTAEVACQCIAGNDKESVYCQIIGLQMAGGKLNLELESTEKAHIAPVRELLAKNPSAK